MYRRSRPLLAVSLILAALPSAAQNAPPQGAWKLDGEVVRVVNAGIALPVKAGILALGRTMEASEKGKGIDDVAQYTSESGETTGTAYVYFTTYADAALASLATDRAIRLRFGPDVTLSSETLTAAGNVPSAAIRRVYEKAVVDGRPTVTLAAFVRAVSWMVVFRVSAPAGDRAKAEEALDALIAGLRFDGSAKPIPAAKAQLAAPCPADDHAARFLGGKKSMAGALLGGVFGGSILIEQKGEPKADPLPPAFPANGQMPFCVSGEIRSGADVWSVLRPAGANGPATELVAVNDAGQVLAVEPTLDLKGFVLKMYNLGRVEVYGTFDRLLTPAQLGDVLAGKAFPGTQMLSSATIDPHGGTQVNIDPNLFK